MSAQTRVFGALIRTHHITSRKKVTRLKQAAAANNVYALLRSGGAPGMMYVEGEHENVRQWIDVVNRLRYKDYQLAAKITQLQWMQQNESGLYEVDTVKQFAEVMHKKDLTDWWRAAMGYTGDHPDRL